MTAQPLYALVAEQMALMDELAEAQGEMTPELAARFDAITERLDVKLKAVAYMIRNLTAESDKHAEEARRQANRASVLQNSAKSLKVYAEYQMALAGITKVDGVMAIQANGGQPSIVFQGEVANLPEAFRTTIYGMDRAAVLTAHAAGQPLPEGVRVERGHHVRLLV